MHACEMTREAHCPHNTEGVMNITRDPGDTGPLVVITVTDTCTANRSTDCAGTVHKCGLTGHAALPVGWQWAHC